MNPNNFRIIRKDGNEYDMETLGIIVNRLIIPSPTIKTQYEENESGDGVNDLGTFYTSREIESVLTARAVDIHDYALLINEIYKMFDSREAFYLIPDREPGKRFEVKLSSPLKPQQMYLTGEMGVNLVCAYPYAESIGTTLDPRTFENELWQTGQGVVLDETMYTQSTTSFQIYNAADGVTVNPRKVPLVINFKGASTDLEIMNLTTGDTWKYTGSTSSTDTVELNGTRSLKNGVSIFSNTNHQLISLAPGYNDFQITGTSGSFTISFAFRFYTL